MKKSTHPTEQIAKEKLRIVDVVKENAGMVITIVGLVWVLIQLIVLPIKALEYSTSDIINNHLKTIQDEQVIATEERKNQSEKLTELSNQIVRLQTLIEEMQKTVK
jgi:hypothetical protein